MRRIIEQVKPDEVYNLAAQSHVRISFDQPEYTADAVGLGALRLLEALRDHNVRRGRSARFYQAGSSEMFGKVVEVPQRETTPFHPRSPYACAKVYAHYQTINYREAYGLFACNGILFNHESPRRPANYVTRKITRAAARIAVGLDQDLLLGNLDGGRDWGYAPEYVEAMWRMLQQPAAGDYVIATNQWHTLTELLDLAFSQVNLDWNEHVRKDPRLARPAEAGRLQGDYGKAQAVLGWTPQTDFAALIRLMVEFDREQAALAAVSETNKRT
jgi:GDPmannose 4,6-dehydratase